MIACRGTSGAPHPHHDPPSAGAAAAGTRYPAGRALPRVTSGRQGHQGVQLNVPTYAWSPLTQPSERHKILSIDKAEARMIDQRRAANEAEREETAKLILQAARQLFMAHGYRAVSTRQVAEAVGLTQPALYHHFATKEEL